MKLKALEMLFLFTQQIVWLLEKLLTVTYSQLIDLERQRTLVCFICAWRKVGKRLLRSRRYPAESSRLVLSCTCLAITPDERAQNTRNSVAFALSWDIKPLTFLKLESFWQGFSSKEEETSHDNE